MLIFNATPEELNVFLDELEEQLQLLEENIVKLEKEKTQQAVSEIFRVAHTVKGSAASLGHQKMAKLTHAMENILDKIRQGKIAIQKPIVDALLQSLDALKILKGEIESKKESDLDLSDLLERFAGLTAATPQKSAPPPPAPSPAPAAPKEDDFKSKVEGKILEALSQGMSAFEIKVTLASDCELPIVRAFQINMELSKIGEIPYSNPSSGQIRGGEVAFEEFYILFLGSCKKEDCIQTINTCSDIGKVKIRKLAKKDLPSLPVVAPPPPPESDEYSGTEGVLETEAPVEAGELAEEAVETEVILQKLPEEGVATPSFKIGRTVRVNVELLDNLMNLVGELVTDRTRLTQLGVQMEIIRESDSLTEELLGTSQHISKITNELQEEIMKARLISIETVFNKFPRMIRDLADRIGKEVNLIIEGEETELDRSVIEEIGDPLIHILRNAVDHGIELPAERGKLGKPLQGTIRLTAAHQENHILITVWDDGKGMDAHAIKEKAIKKGLVDRESADRMTEKEALELIFLPGFSTAEQISDVSGRGVGMDIVKNNIQRISGSVEVETEVGKGTNFIIRIPLTLAILQALLVSLDKIVLAIPLSSIAEIVRMTQGEIKSLSGKRVFMLRGVVVPLVSLAELYNWQGKNSEKEHDVVVVQVGEQKVGIVVDALAGKQEVVIKTLGHYVGDLPGISGATILGDGTVGLIMDVPSFVNAVAQSRHYQSKWAS
ncbi:MAG: chemotaxis protein CheA [Armatimonadetes bacterium]|nr:chemotaxis protein CheA [Armatimonadota bacterium]